MKHGDQMWRLQETRLFTYLIILVEYYVVGEAWATDSRRLFLVPPFKQSIESTFKKKNALSMIPGMSKISRRY